MNNKNLITILIIIIAILTISLIGAIVYIVTNISTPNAPIMINTYSKNEVISNQTEDNSVITDNTVTNDTVDSNENNEVNNNELNTNIPNNEENENTNVSENEQENVVTPTQPPEEDMEKLLFNSDIIAFLGEVTGEQIQQLLNILDESNNNNPNHQITISSNSIAGPNEIVQTEKYVVTLSYDDGYICTVNIDKKNS